MEIKRLHRLKFCLLNVLFYAISFFKVIPRQDTHMAFDELVPRPKVAKELGLTHRSICRYETEKRPGFDRAVKIGGRVFHPRSCVEAIKVFGNNLVRETESTQPRVADTA